MAKNSVHIGLILLKSKQYSTPFTKGESIGYDYLSPDGPKNQCFRVEAFVDDAAGIA